MGSCKFGSSLAQSPLRDILTACLSGAAGHAAHDGVRPAFNCQPLVPWGCLGAHSIGLLGSEMFLEVCMEGACSCSWSAERHCRQAGL